MTTDTRTINIGIALVIAAGLVGGAYYLSGAHSPFSKTAEAQSTQALLAAYAARDSDSDGLPDWQEALYGTDPRNAHSVSQTLTDAQAVAQGLVKPRFASEATSTDTSAASLPGVAAAPTTLTDQFARTLFSQYLQNRGNSTPTPQDIAAFVQSSVDSLVSSQKKVDAYSSSQVVVSGTGSAALLTYAAGMEAAFAANTVATDKGELDYYSDAVTKNDASALKQVGAISDAYINIAKAVMKVPVPKEAQAAHLEIANAVARMGAVSADMATVNDDPIRGMLGLAQYQDAALALAHSFADMDAVYTAQGITIPQGTDGYYFVNELNDAATSLQQAGK